MKGSDILFRVWRFYRRTRPVRYMLFFVFLFFGIWWLAVTFSSTPITDK